MACFPPLVNHCIDACNIASSQPSTSPSIHDIPSPSPVQPFKKIQDARAYQLEASRQNCETTAWPSILFPRPKPIRIQHPQLEIDIDEFLEQLFSKSPEILRLLCGIKSAPCQSLFVDLLLSVEEQNGPTVRISINVSARGIFGCQPRSSVEERCRLADSMTGTNYPDSSC